MATVKQKVVPHLWFDTEAVEAAAFYCSIFPDSKVLSVSKIYDTPSGDCDIVVFELMGQTFNAISAGPIFKFNESISFIINCDTQDEMDYYYEKLSSVPEAEQCGWIKDKYGLSWQIVPTLLDELMTSKDVEKTKNLTQALLKMKKLNIEALLSAYGEE